MYEYYFSMLQLHLVSYLAKRICYVTIGKFSSAAGERVKPLQYYCNDLPISYFIDQKKTNILA